MGFTEVNAGCILAAQQGRPSSRKTQPTETTIFAPAVLFWNIFYWNKIIIIIIFIMLYDDEYEYKSLSSEALPHMYNWVTLCVSVR